MHNETQGWKGKYRPTLSRKGGKKKLIVKTVKHRSILSTDGANSFTKSFDQDWNYFSESTLTQPKAMN